MTIEYFGRVVIDQIFVEKRDQGCGF